MLISLNWINDYVDLKNIPLKEQINRFLLSTAEIENVYEKGKDVQNVIFARVDEVASHPNSQKLHILKVFTGKETLQIVCGAPNVKVGMITALAQIGSVVKGTKISKAKLVGVESFGMCCSQAELGIGSDDSGIMDITDKVEIGQDIKSFYPVDDIVFEIDNKSLTNRPDLWGHYGIAREFGAIFKRPLKKLPVEDLTKFDNLPKLKIEIENKNCFRYSGLTLKNITEQKLPQYMIIRLNYVGQRDINLLADLTNYVMLDIGQPMHAFDNEKVKGIIVTNSVKDEKMLTLDDENRTIPANSIMICNCDRQPVAIAGIKGGKLSGINENTTSLFLESACFDATTIRRTSFALALRTDSSLRYEKSLDPNLTTVAISRYLKLLQEIDNNIIVTSSLTDKQTFAYDKIQIEFDLDFVIKRTGIAISKEEVVEILTNLKFEVKTIKEHFFVTVPSYRATKDISIKEDIIEEIARMYGYDNIKGETIRFKVEPTKQDYVHEIEYKTKVLLSGKYGFSEVHSHIWNFAQFNEQNEIKTEYYLSLLDSTNSGNVGIRSKMLPTLIKFFDENKNSFEEIKMYEIGRVVSGLDKNNLAIENKKLAILYASQTKNKEQLLFDLKKIYEDISQTLLCDTCQFSQDKNDNLENFYSPANNVKILVNNEEVGEFGLVHPKLNAKLDKRFLIAISEIDFEKFVNLSKPHMQKFENISKFQDVNLDFNFKVDNNLTYEKVAQIIGEFDSKLDFKYTLKDIYSQADFKNFSYWTFAFNIVHKKRTLTSEDIEKFITKLTEHMKQHEILLKE